MAGTPIIITLYGPDSEPGKEYSRSIVPWGVLKKAIALTKSIDQKNVTEADMDAIAGLVVEVFGGQFTLQELDQGADIGELLSILQSIVARAGTLVRANPTPVPVSKKKKR